MVQPTAAPRILVVDDMPHMLALFQVLLQRAGYRVGTTRFAIGLAPLLEAIKAAPPDLIVLDLIFREEQRGWPLLQALKLDRETRPIPVIVSSVAVELVARVQPQLEAMGVHVLLRPFQGEHLLELTATALERG